MDDVRPLRELFDEMAGGRPAPADGWGHDLPEDLLTEAIISYADTAPAEVAAHLAPFVTARSAIGTAGAVGEIDQPWDAADGLELLAAAPTGLDLDQPYGGPADPLDSAPAPDAEPELDFGHGADPDLPVDSGTALDGFDAGDGGFDLPGPADLDTGTLDDTLDDTGDDTGWEDGGAFGSGHAVPGAGPDAAPDRPDDDPDDVTG
jgi:hypothetical protein